MKPRLLGDDNTSHNLKGPEKHLPPQLAILASPEGVHGSGDLSLVPADRDPLRPQVTARLRSACSSTASTCSRVTPGNQVRNSFTVAPSSRFSNRARTGTRVALNTQAPLTFPGTRSTAAH